MAIDPKTLTVEQLEALIENHRRRGRADEPLCLEALAELERRKSPGLDFDITMRIIRRAAAERRFLSYKDIADESKAEWSRIHWKVGDHLTRLCEYSHRKGWPLLSAIVVNKANLSTGALEPESLRGFVAVARGLGYAVTDEEAFLRAEQACVFAWAQNSGQSAA